MHWLHKFADIEIPNRLRLDLFCSSASGRQVQVWMATQVGTDTRNTQ